MGLGVRAVKKCVKMCTAMLMDVQVVRSGAHAQAQKMYNWTTLNQKVFRRLGFLLEKAEYLPVTNGEPGAIERVLKLVRARIAERGFLRQNPGAIPGQNPEAVPRQNPGAVPRGDQGTPQGSARAALHDQGAPSPWFGEGEGRALVSRVPQGDLLREPGRGPLQQYPEGAERESVRAPQGILRQNLGSATGAADTVWRAGAGSPGDPQACETASLPCGVPGQPGGLAREFQSRLALGDGQVCIFAIARSTSILCE